jgi:hypothetical protein
VQHCNHPWISLILAPKHLLKRFGRRPEKNVINSFFVRQYQFIKFMRYRENHMVITNRQKIRSPLLDPFTLRCKLALDTVPVATRVVGLLAVIAPVTFVNMTAQGSRTTLGDGFDHLLFLPG